LFSEGGGTQAVGDDVEFFGIAFEKSSDRFFDGFMLRGWHQNLQGSVEVS